MSDKIKKIYAALVDGAVAGKSGPQLFAHVREHCAKATSKKIVKASLLALSDPDIKDANILNVIYALAIKHRLDPVNGDDLDEAQDAEADAVQEAPAVKAKAKKKAKPALDGARAPG